MKIVFMGTPDFAVPSLEMLIHEKYDIAGVFTQPDRPKGRGNKLTMSPIKEKAIENNLQVYQPTTLKDKEVIETLEKLNPDALVVVAYGQLLTKEILSIPSLGCINVHASLLPKYRGAGPIQWAIINGEEITGITTMYMEEGLDTGDMIHKREIRIGKDETAAELQERLSVLGSSVLKDTLIDIKDGSAPREIQDQQSATYAPRLTKEIGCIKWNQSADEIHNLIRGTIPWPVAYTDYLGKTMKIWKSSVEKNDKIYPPGKIIDVTKDKIIVATGQDLLLIEELQFSGGKRLKVQDFLVGNKIEKNVVLGMQNANE